MEKKLEDWYLRYGFILDRRFTDKQKETFIRSLITDITSMHLNPQTDQFRLTEKGEEYTNIYVGNIEKAHQVICTYYDTPSLHLRGYRFFDNETNKRNTLIVNITLAVIWLMLGVLMTLYVAIPVFNIYGIWNIRALFLTVFFIVYFIILNKFSRGIAKRKNLVRNSSSILAILDLMERNKKKNKVAYAFLDSGVTSGGGLERLKEKTTGKILYLDSIGSVNELYLVSSSQKTLNNYPNSQSLQKVQLEDLKDNQLSYLISAQHENDFYLNRNEIGSKKMNSKNLAVVSAYLKEVIH